MPMTETELDEALTAGREGLRGQGPLRGRARRAARQRRDLRQRGRAAGLRREGDGDRHAGPPWAGVNRTVGAPQILSAVSRFQVASGALVV